MTFTLVGHCRKEWNPSYLKPCVTIFSCDDKHSASSWAWINDSWLQPLWWKRKSVTKGFTDPVEGLWRSPAKVFYLSTLQFHWRGCRVNSHCRHAQSCKDQTPGDAINKVKFAHTSFNPHVIAFALISSTQPWSGEKAKPNVSRSDARDITKALVKHGGLDALSRSRSIDSSWFTSRAALHKSHCSRDSCPDWALKLWS